jgi:hypothetical protein
MSVASLPNLGMQQNSAMANTAKHFTTFSGDVYSRMKNNRFPMQTAAHLGRKPRFSSPEDNRSGPRKTPLFFGRVSRTFRL